MAIARAPLYPLWPLAQARPLTDPDPIAPPDRPPKQIEAGAVLLAGPGGLRICRQISRQMSWRLVRIFGVGIEEERVRPYLRKRVVLGSTDDLVR